eukprot:m.97718 g.97718  ORF g.97718 m.97718 type:complete len:1204 (+) comp27004_c0_seq2:178-3789(+)
MSQARAIVNPKAFAKGKWRKGGNETQRGGASKQQIRVRPKPIEIYLSMETKSMLVELLKKISSNRGGLDIDINLDDPVDEQAPSTQKLAGGQKVIVHQVVGAEASARKCRITHAHKDGTYTVTYEDTDCMPGAELREKRVHPSRISSIDPPSRSSRPASNANYSDKVSTQLKNLKLLGKMEAADRKLQGERKKKEEEAQASASAAKQKEKEKKPKQTSAKVRVEISNGDASAKSRQKKVVVVERKLGVAGLLKIAKTKLNIKKPKSLIDGPTGEHLADLDSVVDGAEILVSSVAVVAPSTTSATGTSHESQEHQAPQELTSNSSAISDIKETNSTIDTINKMRHMYQQQQRQSADDRTTPTNVEALHASLKKHLHSISTSTEPQQARIRQQRQKLPAHSFREKLLDLINGNRVCVIEGSTGCGKTTQIPQFILEDTINAGVGGDCNIVCTQPRRISAIGVADRVSAEWGETVGGSIGYQIRLESRKSKNTRLMFVTTGILLRRLQGDPTLSGVSHLVIDEIHERGVLVDFLLIVLKDVLVANPNLRVVLMSATLDSNIFCKYFGDCPSITIPGHTFAVETYYLEHALSVAKYDPSRSGGQQVRQGSARGGGRGGRGGGGGRGGRGGRGDGGRGRGRGDGHHTGGNQSQGDVQTSTPRRLTDWGNYSARIKQNVETIDENTHHDKIEYGLIEALLVHLFNSADTKDDKGAVLIFLPGIMEITKTQDRIKANSSLRSAHIVCLHSSLPSASQRLVFNPPPKGMRKVVLSTNIAETSITVDDVTIVIDAGRVKEMRYDSGRRMGILEQTWISQASATQRSGRAGRVQKGTCYRLYSRERHSIMAEFQTPEIQRVPLEDLILQIKSQDLGDPFVFLSRAVTPPRPKAVEGALQNLADLGAIEREPQGESDKLERTPSQLTPLGFHLALLPVDARLGKMLIYASIFSCLEPILTIAATMSLKSPFMSPMGYQKEADAAKRKFAVDGNSDHFMTWRAYEQWDTMSSHSRWDFCQKNYLSHTTLQQIRTLRDQLRRHLREAGFVSEQTSSSNTNSENIHLLRCILTAGLYPNVARLLSKGNDPGQLTTLTEDVCFHPSSTNSKLVTTRDSWVVYLEKVETSKVWVKDSTVVTAFALLLFGGMPIVNHDKGRIVVDDWIVFLATPAIGVLFQLIRKELDVMLVNKIGASVTDQAHSAAMVAKVVALLAITA